MDTSVAICVGLKSIAHFISNEKDVDPAAEAELIRSGITIPLGAVPNDAASKEFPVYEWEVVNQSEGGVKVRRTYSSPTASPSTASVALTHRFQRGRSSLAPLRFCCHEKL